MSAAGWLLVLGAAPAWAGVEGRVGLGMGLAADLRDRLSAGEVQATQWRAGPALVVPVRIELSRAVAVRLDLRLEGASGVDELTWSEQVDGVTVRRSDADGHLAMFFGLGLDVGLQATVPLRGPARPYLAAGGGLMGVGVYHALRDETAVLLDPEQNRLGDTSNVDPYTLGVAGNVFVAGGVRVDLRERVELWVEMGYSGALVGADSLRKSLPSLDARREAFAWNPLRVGLGFTARLEGARRRGEGDG